MTDAFNDTLRQSTWMDAETRSEAKLKLQEMGRKIGYPDWLLNPTSLDEFYKYIPRLNTSTPFLSLWRSITSNSWKTMLDKLRSPYDADKSWIVGPAVVNAFYSPYGNEIVFPAALLQGVFYQPDLPRFLNIGAIGSVIGHEITHGFDDIGSQFDAEGRLRDWLSKSTRRTFGEKSQCFVKQYGNIYDKEAGMKLYGENTLGENIADNGGLRTAFKVYKETFKEECNGKDARLQGLEELSGEQLFFISNAMVWFDLARPREKKFNIQYDPHSPSEYRINVPMRNMAEFSTVFNCAPRSRMSPDRKKTCVLW
ncbi:neprilysin-1-like [Haemaphysalis longicornis]